MMVGSTKMGTGRTTRVNAVSAMACGTTALCTRFTSKRTFTVIPSVGRADGCRLTWAANHSFYRPPSKVELTCVAAILEEPTTFPLASSTSMPSDSSLCLIRATLQMFALAEYQDWKIEYNARLHYGVQLRGGQQRLWLMAIVAFEERTNCWKWDKSLYYHSGGWTQLIGLLNKHIQSHLQHIQILFEHMTLVHISNVN